MPNNLHVTVTAPGTFYWFPDRRISPFGVNMQVIVPGGTTATYEVDFTLDNPNSTLQNAPPVTWTPLAVFPAGSTTTITAPITAPVECLRLVVGAVSGGPLYWNAIQGDSIL